MASVNITFPGNIAQVESKSALRAVPSVMLLDSSVYLVDDVGLYGYDPGSLAADDNAGVIRPNDLTLLQAGRWLLSGAGIFDIGVLDKLGASDGATRVYSQRSASYLPRTVEARLSDAFINLADDLTAAQLAGITAGTSTFDATAVLTAAIAKAAAAKATLQLPPGVIRVSGAGATVVSGTRIVGAGRDKTTIRKLASTDSYVLNGANLSGINISGLTLDGIRPANSSYINSNFCLYLTNCTDIRLFDLFVTGARADGVVLEKCKRVRALFCEASFNGKDGFYIPGSDELDFEFLWAFKNGSPSPDTPGVSNGYGFAGSAAYNWSITNFRFSGNVEGEIIVSRDGAMWGLRGGVLGDSYYGSAPISMAVLGELIENQTLHQDVNGNGGTTYGTGVSYGGSRGLVSDVKFRGQVNLELLQATVFDATCVFENSVGHAVVLIGCAGLRFLGSIIRDWASGGFKGIALLNSAKNGGVSNTDILLDGVEWIKAGAVTGDRIADFVGAGGLKEYGSKLNGALLPVSTGWTAGTGSANKAAFASYAGSTRGATYSQAEAQATDNAARDASQRLLALEQAVRLLGAIN